MATATPQPIRRPAAAPQQPVQPEPSEDPSESEDPFAQQDAADASGIEDDLENDVLDLSDVEEVTGRDVIPSGTYDLYVDKAEYKLSKAGNKMFAIQFLARMPDAEEYTFRLFYHPTFSPKDIGRTKHAVNILLNGDVDWAQFKGSAIADRLIGTYCRGKVGQQSNPEYGKSNTIRELLPAADAMGGFTS